MRRSRRLAVGLLAASLGSAAADTPAPTVSPARPFAVESVFQTADRPPARDLSGIACKPAPEGAAQRLCLVVNDRDRFAQIATLTNGGITPGPTVVLLGARPSETVVGVAPQGMACSAGEAGFSDLDGEAVAYAEPYFYILGSHGCSRSREYRPSRFILARVRIDDQGRVVGKVGHEAASPVDALRLTETTYRLSEALRMVEPVGAQFGRDLEPNGLNLEGLAIVGGVLYAGLRAPSLDGYAYIVSTDVEPLFTPDTPLEPRVIPLALGRDAGIRDLAPLPDGRILVLAGPAQDQLEVHFALFALDLREGRFTRLATLDDPQGICTPGPRAISGKPEAVLPLGLDEDWLRVLILSDSLPNGAPCEYRVPRQ
jgi:Protein of unknown function (DUF3616)